jgi:formate hydrogenlyase subunit 4
VSALIAIVHVLVALATAPLLLGVITRVKAKIAGRVGAPLLQPYWDLWRLIHKGSVFSTTTSWVFRAGPIVSLASTVCALLFVPMASERAAIAFTGDFIVLAYVLGLGRFFTVAAALDTGSPFEGMGGAREASFACLAEPAFLLALLVPALGSRSLSLSLMLGDSLSAQWSTVPAPLVLILVSLFIVMLAENCRIPFDDPSTHLELTMIHEVMVLDHSGPAFGAILYGASLKLYVLGALIVRIAFPFHTGIALLDLLLFTAEMMALAASIGIVESAMARLRLTQVPNLLISACILSALAIVFPVQ